MTHQDLCRLKDEARAAAEIDDGKAAIEARRRHARPCWFRTPYGVRCERVDAMLAERGITHFHWDLDPQEWKHGNAEEGVRLRHQAARADDRPQRAARCTTSRRRRSRRCPQILDWIDEENARAQELAHKRRIRIIQSYELAAEQLPPGLLDWLADATARARGLAYAIASVLP